ncbi:hypothetical protein [uncultured Tenacibaculum sp.]|uniref:hypothetical protein n=1 Tax=uncultured Tenacibaculum sp. TaxID=174713 RepID=UPI002605D412|nr:hypothetical protein [uncultured Tenacibaculum sp.]
MNWLKKNKLLVGIGLFPLIVFLGYKYTYKPHKTIENLVPVYTGNAIEFLQKASLDFKQWNTNIIEITGQVTGIDTKGITLDNKIFCQLKHVKKLSILSQNQKITIKGRVVGYDDLLEELKLNQCILK